MDDDRQQAFMTALVTEHFVLQGARGQTNAEMTGRAALYLATVSSTLIALGFVARDRSAFVPFAAAVIPSLLILGEFTFIRLVAASMAVAAAMPRAASRPRCGRRRIRAAATEIGASRAVATRAMDR